MKGWILMAFSQHGSRSLLMMTMISLATSSKKQMSHFALCV
jgi:hypothetical protein